MSKLNKTLRIVSFSIFGFIGFIMIMSIIVSVFSNDDDSQKSNYANEASETGDKSDNKLAIPGLMPVDVYLNLENKGFNKKYTLSELGHSWKCTMSQAGIDYEVYIFSSDDNSVESVSASATLTPPKRSEAVLQFMQYASSIPYDGSDQIKIVEWITNNFNKNKATTTIGGVSFTINAPNDFVRMLSIRKSM